MRDVRGSTSIAAFAAIVWACTASNGNTGFNTTSGKDGGSSSGDDSGSSGDDAGGGDDAAPQDTGPPPCQYPAGPYGKTVGSTVAPTLSWQCYNGSSSVSTVHMKDLFDCDGRFGINALMIDESALWCGPCNQEAQDTSPLITKSSKWYGDGVRIMTLIVDGVNQGAGSTIADANTWRTEYSLNAEIICTDSAFSFAHTGTNGLPMNFLVDPRTMKILDVDEGYGGQPGTFQDGQTVDGLALKNKK